jgi:predicted peptidase
LGRDFDLPAVLIAPQCQAGQTWQSTALMELIDETVRRFPIEERRIYAMGHSMGGFGVWNLLCHDAERFAAAVIICGGGNPGQAASPVRVPLWAFHGGKDDVVPSSSIEALVTNLNESGGQARLTLLPDQGHSIIDVPFIYPEVVTWLLQQEKRSAPATDSVSSMHSLEVHPTRPTDRRPRALAAEECVTSVEGWASRAKRSRQFH